MPAAGRFLLLACLAFSASAVEARYDWEAIPTSRLADQIQVLVARLHPTLAGKRCLVAPFVGTRHHLNTWAFETIAERRFVAALRDAGVTVVDDAPLRARYRPQEPGLPPTVPYSTRTITELAAACGADLVLLGGCQILSESLVTVYVHGKDGRRLAKDEIELDEQDVALPALTPPSNRQLVTWAETRLGKASPTTADFAEQALTAAGGRTICPPRTIPLPGDVVAWLAPTRFRWLRRPRVAVVYEVIEPCRLEVIVPNWRDGARTVGVERVTLPGFRFALLRPTAAR